MAIAVANRLARRLGLDKRELAEFSGPAEGLSVFVARAAAVCSCAAFAAPCVRGIFIQQQGMADYVPVAVAYIVATLLIARATFWISGVAAAGGNCALLHAFFAAYKQFDRDAPGRCRDFWRCGGIGPYCQLAGDYCPDYCRALLAVLPRCYFSYIASAAGLGVRLRPLSSAPKA